MVKYRNVCAVLNCQKNGSKQSLLMHSLDSYSRHGKIWYQLAKFGSYDESENLEDQALEPDTKRIFICESHFKDSDYEAIHKFSETNVRKRKKKLKRTAIPSLNLPRISGFNAK